MCLSQELALSCGVQQLFRKAWQLLRRGDEYRPMDSEYGTFSSAGCLRGWELSCRRVGKTLGIWSFFPFPFSFLVFVLSVIGTGWGVL